MSISFMPQISSANQARQVVKPGARRQAAVSQLNFGQLNFGHRTSGHNHQTSAPQLSGWRQPVINMLQNLIDRLQQPAQPVNNLAKTESQAPDSFPDIRVEDYDKFHHEGDPLWTDGV